MALLGEAEKHGFETKKPKNQIKNQKISVINQLFPYWDGKSSLGWH